MATEVGRRRGLSNYFGVGGVGLLTYVGEYSSYIVVLAFLSDKLTVPAPVGFGLGDAGYALVGTISAAYLVLSGLVAIPIGHLSDKYGRRRFTMIGCLMGSGSLLSLVVINGLTNLIDFSVSMGAALVILGAAHGIYTASTLAYTGDVAESEGEMGKSFGLIEGAEFAGYAFGPALGTTLSYLFGTRTAVFETSSAMLFAAFLVAFFFMRGISRVPIDAAASHLRHEDETTRIPTSQELPGDVGDVHEHSVSWGDFISAFRTPIIAVVLLTTFIGSIGFSGFFYFVSLYAHAESGLVPAFSLLYGYFASIMAATAVVLMVPLGHLEDRGKRRMPYLAAGLVLGSLSLVLIFGVSPSVPSFVTASLAFGGSIAMIRVSQLVLLAERSSTSNRAAIMGTNHAVEHAGYGVASLVVGTLIALFGSFAKAFQGLALVMVISGIVFYAYGRWKKIV